MRFTVSIEKDLPEVMNNRLDRLKRAATSAVAVTAKEVQAAMRQQVISAGLGSRLARTIRSQSFPRGGAASLDAAANIWTNAPHIISAFNKGVTIRARDGFWLAFPTEDAGKGITRGRITPEEWQRRNGVKLRPVIRPGKPVLLVAEMRARAGKRGGFAMPSDTARKTGRGLATVVIFILVPQTRLPKKLSFDEEFERGRARLIATLSQMINRKG